MKRTLILAYGVLTYVFFFVAFIYAIGFIGNIAVPKSLDSAPTDPLVTALAIDAALLALFAVQHSGMARPAFKRWLTRYIPEPAERSTYVLASTACLVLLMAFWSPLGGVVWQAPTEWAAVALQALYLGSWGLLLYATFLIDHFDLFGLRQAWAAFHRRRSGRLQFVTPALYRIVRHPIYVGWIGIFWFTPTMTVSHLVFAVGATAYTLFGMKLEERDLEAMHPEYARYKRKVPALVPSPKRRLESDAGVST